MIKLIPLFLKNWKLLALGIVIIGIVFYHANRTSTINSLEKENIVLTTQVADANRAIDNQNNAIIAMQADNKKLAIKIREDGLKFDAELELIASKPIAETCEQAINELKEMM